MATFDEVYDAVKKWENGFDEKCLECMDSNQSVFVRSIREQIYSGYISMVRWNTEKNEIEIFFNSNDGYISEWLPETYIEFDREAIYKTILEFTD